MDEAEPEKQRSMVTKSSIKRKPFADLTNIVRKSNNNSSFFQSKKPGPSNASDSSIGSTQNPINLHRSTVCPSDHPIQSKPQRLKPDHLPVEVNLKTQAQRHSPQNNISRTKDVFPFYQSSLQARRNNVKEGSVSTCSSTLNKIKDHVNLNQSCLDKAVNDGKKISLSTEKIKDRSKSDNMPLSAHHMKNVSSSSNTSNPNSTMKLKEKAKEITGNANSNMCITTPESLLKRKDKGKEIAESLDYPSRKKLKNYMMEFDFPLKGVTIKEKECTVTDSGSVNLAQKDKGKLVSAPINNHTLGKKDQQSSCPSVLRTMSNRNVADETVLQSKLRTEPPPNKKKKRCPTKVVKEEYTLPQDFVEQQRAYFKEIDDFELQVEEV